MEKNTNGIDNRVQNGRFVVSKSEQEIKRQLFNFLGLFGKDIKTKISNVNGKTASYYVPEAIYTKRTSRRNSVLLPWKDLVFNNLTLEQLKTFYGGVTIEFVNEDFFVPNTNDQSLLELYNFLKTKCIGSDDQISAIITFHSECGSSSSQKERDYYQMFINDTIVKYKENDIEINKDTIAQYYLKCVEDLPDGTDKHLSNNTWSGFIFVDISGGQQNSIRSHPDKNHHQTIFNPACEYANDQVMNDIDLVLGYYILFSIDENSLLKYAAINNIDYETMLKRKTTLISQIEDTLKQRQYDNSSFTGTLYDFVQHALSLKIEDGKLFDPLQLKEISIQNFIDVDARTGNSLDLTHDEPVSKKHFYWDEKQKFILSAAMPTNIFWSYHLSNMMQQEFSLFEYFQHEAAIYQKRQEIFKKLNIDINKQ